MIWNGQELKTVGNLFDAVSACTTKDEADALMTALRADNPNADANVGYVIGYAGDEDRARLYGLFELTHPVYGKTV